MQNKTGVVAQIKSEGFEPASSAARKANVDLSFVIKLCERNKIDHRRASRTFYVKAAELKKYRRKTG